MVKLLPDPWVCQMTPPRSSAVAPGSSLVRLVRSRWTIFSTARYCWCRADDLDFQGARRLVPGVLLRAAAPRLLFLLLDRYGEDVVPKDVEQVDGLEDCGHELLLFGRILPGLQQLRRDVGLPQSVSEFVRVVVVGLGTAPWRKIAYARRDRAELGGAACGSDQQLNGLEESGDSPGHLARVALVRVVLDGVSGVRAQVPDRETDGVLEIRALALDDRDGDAVHEEDEVGDLLVSGRGTDA